MERLTKVGEDGYVYRINCEISDADAWNKLAHYEDLVEKGLLVELPCKVGDTVWCINKNYKQPYCETVGYFYIDDNGISFINDYEDSNYEFGKDAFLTESEAEQALADMN